MNKKLVKNLLLAGLSILIFIIIISYMFFILKKNDFPTTTKRILAVPLAVSAILIIYLFVCRIKKTIKDYRDDSDK